MLEKKNSYLFKLFAKVIVEPSVKERIITGTTHSEAMCHEKTKFIIYPIIGRRIKIIDNVYDIKR